MAVLKNSIVSTVNNQSDFDRFIKVETAVLGLNFFTFEQEWFFSMEKSGKDTGCDHQESAVRLL